MKKLLQKAVEAHQRHQRRHTPGALGMAISDGIRHLDARDWDALTSARSVFMSRRYLRVLEEAGAENVKQRYALLYRGDTPVAAVCAQAVTVDGTRVIKGKSTSAASALARKAAAGALEHWQERLLVCGNVMSWGPHGVAFAPGEDPRALFEGVAEALYRIRRADRMMGESDFMMVKDLHPEHAEGAEALRTFSFRPMETEPDMVLAIRPEWKTMEDYLASLSTKYRKVARGLDKDLEKAGYTLEDTRVDARNADRIHALYIQVHDGAPVRLCTLRPEFLPRMQEAFGDDFRVTVARRGEDANAFVSSLKDGPNAVGYYVGFDRAANAEAPLYFRMLQATVGHAMALGARELSLGRTALEPKARLGCMPRPITLWMRHRVPMLNVILRSLLASVPHDEPPARSVFK
jgi:predicted N-acyltransferase